MDNFGQTILAMRRLESVFVCLLSVSALQAQQEGGVEVLMRQKGVSTVEEMDAGEMERLSYLLARKIKINSASYSMMESSGLFTPFQMASLRDYRSRHGNIFSFTELSAIDGFTEKIVRRLKPFISLENTSGMYDKGQRSPEIRNYLSVRGAFKHEKGPYYAYGIKYRMESSTGLQFSLSTSNSYDDDALPSGLSGNFVWNHHSGKLVVGDFNARFGQGLCLWNAMTMSGLSSISSFMRISSGLSPSFSYKGDVVLRGAAADFSMGKWKLSVLTAFPDIVKRWKFSSDARILPAINIARYGAIGQLSLTHMMVFSGCFDRRRMVRIPDMKTALDLALCLNGVNLYAETSYDWVNRTVAFVGGTDFQVTEPLRMAVLLRFYPPSYAADYTSAARASSRASNEYGIAVSGEYDAGDTSWLAGQFSADAVYYPAGKVGTAHDCIQIKARLGCNVIACKWLEIGFRLSERLRTWGIPSRTEARMDLNAASGMFRTSLRLEMSKGIGLGLLTYAEEGYENTFMSVYCRVGVFAVDRWDDRIYVYERDAPDSFNMPAFYGRGLWTSAVASVKFMQGGRLYVRASYMGYPFMGGEKRKSGRTECRISCIFNI